MFQNLSFQDYQKIKAQEFVLALLSHTTHYSSTKWYAGITSQSDSNNDGRADRINQHISKYPKLNQGSWFEIDTKDSDIALMVEQILHNKGFKTGNSLAYKMGNVKNKPTIVYIFIYDDERDVKWF